MTTPIQPCCSCDLVEECELHQRLQSLEAKLKVAVDAMDDCYSECCDGYAVMNIVTRARAALRGES